MSNYKIEIGIKNISELEAIIADIKEKAEELRLAVAKIDNFQIVLNKEVIEEVID